jgi:hypothetical protein
MAQAGQSTDPPLGDSARLLSVSSKKHIPNPAGKAGHPVSLHPLSFDEAVAGLAQVKMPEPEKEKPKATPKKGNG